MEFIIDDYPKKRTEVVVLEGGYVYCSRGDFYAEWQDLSAEQQQAFSQARDTLSLAFQQVQEALSKHLYQPDSVSVLG